MRGGKSFLVLLVLALGVGAYAYFVESKRDLTDPTTKHAKVFSIDSGKIEEIEVKAASGDVTRIKKNGADWQIVAPETVDADASAVNTLVTSLESIETQRVVDDNPSSVAVFGLEPPRYSVAFRLTGEATMRRLNVGNKTPNGADLYARVDGQPKLLLIGSFVDDSFNRTTFDLREKSALKFAREGVDSLKLEAAASPALSLGKKGSDWRLTAPVDAKADVTAVEGIIGQIAQAKMKSIVASIGAEGLSAADSKKYGLDKPQAVVTVGAGSTRATLAIGAKVDDTTVYARDLSRPIVFTVEKTVLDGLTKKPDDLRAKDLFEFRSFSAVTVDITQGGQTFTFVKEKVPAKDQTPASETWKQTKPTAKDVNQTALTDLLTSLSNLRAEKFADHPLTSGDDTIVTAKFGDAASPKQERVTFRKSGAVVHAIRAGEPGAAIVPTADFDKAITAFKDLAGIK